MIKISQKDKAVLRELAKKQQEYASTPENIEREKQWYLHNDLQGARPMVTIEEWTFHHEVARPLTCETEKGRAFEGQLLGNIIGREDIDDDRSTPDFFSVWRNGWFLPFGLEAKTQGVAGSVAYEFIHPIQDLEKDIGVLGPSTWGFSKDAPDLELAQDIFDDILPVKQFSPYPSGGLSYMLIRYMSMETMLLSLYDYPELFHQVINQLTNDLLQYHKEMETAGVYITNNINQQIGQGTYAHTALLSSKDGAALTDMWGYFDSQETTDVSPDMFAEFFFPYYKRLMDMCGLVNYGCCEPVHGIWDSCLSQCHNIRKLSIAPWCDEEFIGDKLRCTNIIYHRKPSPNTVAAPGTFDEVMYAEHIVKTLKAAKGCKLEFSLRDIYSLGGEKTRANRVVRLIRDMIERHWE